jgi:hypothetical protein
MDRRAPRRARCNYFMSKKNLILIAVTLVLAGVYVVYFTDWFKPKTIHIAHTSRFIRGAFRPGQRNSYATVPIIFTFEREYEFTEIKIVPLAALQTNSLAQPVWHLVSDDGSDSINHFFYGEKIEGMDPVVEGKRPEPLQPGVTYRLFVAAGKAKGQHDFQAKAAH